MKLRRSFVKKSVVTLCAAVTLSVAAAAFSAGCAAPKQGAAGPQGDMTIDEALSAAAVQILSELAPGTKVAVLNYTSPSECLSEYAISELEASIVESGKVTVVDRKELDLIRREMDFQYSSEVRNESAQDLGRKLGAQIIITGAHTDLAGVQRISVRALAVESAAVAAQYRKNIVADAIMDALLNKCDKKPASGANSGGVMVASANTGAAAATATSAASGAVIESESGTNSTVAAITERTGGTTQTAAPAGPANGTYIFYPRLRAMSAGKDIDAYLDRIVVRGGYFNIYLVGAPTGDITKIGTPRGQNNWYINGQWLTLQDLDTPRLSYNAVDVTYESPRIISYQIKQGRRFSLTANWHNAIPMIFEEIDLDKAEFQQ